MVSGSDLQSTEIRMTVLDMDIVGRITWVMRSVPGLVAVWAIATCLSTFAGHASNERYEELMSRLAQARSQSEADALSSEIWRIWLMAPDAAAQEVLDSALVRCRAGDYLGAILHLNRLVGGWPDYTEGWNQRATVHFLLGDLEASLADVAEVLSREPRHFGALSGKAVILFRQGRVALAQITLRKALKHHPFLRERAMLQATDGIDL